MFVSNIILEYLILATGSPQQRGPTFCQLSRRMSNILIWTINTKGVCWLNNYYLESIECWRYMLIYIYFLESFGCWLWPHLPGVSLHNLRSFMYYIINVYVPRVRTNAYQALTTPPRVFRDPKMCLRNIWTAPNTWWKYLTCHELFIPFHT